MAYENTKATWRETLDRWGTVDFNKKVDVYIWAVGCLMMFAAAAALFGGWGLVFMLGAGLVWLARV